MELPWTQRSARYIFSIQDVYEYGHARIIHGQAGSASSMRHPLKQVLLQLLLYPMSTTGLYKHHCASYSVFPWRHNTISHRVVEYLILPTPFCLY